MDKTQSINELISEIEKFREDRNWKQFHNIKDMIISLNLEAGELLELIQWKTSEEVLLDAKNSPEPIADELADIFYWLLIIANDLNIDLFQAFYAKMEKNKSKYPIEKSLNKKDKYNTF